MTAAAVVERGGLEIGSSSETGSRLDGELAQCQSDMEHLRKELAYTHRCVSDLEVNLPIHGSPTESDTEAHLFTEREMEVTVHRLREENARLSNHVHSLQSEIGSLRAMEEEPESSYHPRLEDAALFPGATLDSPGSLSMREEVERLQDQLHRTHDALSDLKLERKRLRLEKGELVGQIREVCSSLEAKEAQLRRFVMEYEAVMREREAGLRVAMEQRCRAEEERERMAANLLNSQAALAHLRHSLTQRDRQNQALTHQLQELQGRFLLLTGQTVDSLESSSSGISSDNSLLSATTPGSQGYFSLSSPGDCSNALLPTPTPSPSGETKEHRLSILEQVKELTQGFQEEGEVEDEAIPPVIMRERKSVRSRSSEGGRLSRIFRLARSKSKDEGGGLASSLLPGSRSCALPAAIREEDAARLHSAAALATARSTPIIKWKQPEILAWLELEMNFPPTVLRLAQENLKSGRVMLTLTDEEMEWSLGIQSPLMRKKLKLGIQDYGTPTLSPYPLMRELGWEYVSGAFLASCGLSEHAPAFRSHLVDARVLAQLSKKEAEKLLGLRKRTHQNSLFRGLELLRLSAFDLRALAERRAACEGVARDLLCWTNQRFARWLHSISLGEFADRLPSSGIHGALVVLERSFTAETLAGSLGIPSSKKMLRKHLSAEFSALLFEARAQLHSARTTLTKSTTFAAHSSLPRPIARSLSPSHKKADGELRRDSKDSPRRLNGIRGSFGKVFGLRARRSLLGSSLRCPSPLRQPLQYIPPPPPPEGTLSSTSDLGSSLERSAHLRPHSARNEQRPHSIAILPHHPPSPPSTRFNPISEQSEAEDQPWNSDAHPTQAVAESWSEASSEDVTIRQQQDVDAAEETDL